ncbi:magnesium transporter [Oryzisolibacter propanilivorax]|uniref:Magnesium transporter MgtE n=1 Tax=Oryzisolibacter propanilivorax TaxID=1527607 RepID=A0A1G9TGA8_9BURK|nr:magnesium transporter [Oryzisolibacter propanilivorax]
MPGWLRALPAVQGGLRTAWRRRRMGDYAWLYACRLVVTALGGRAAGRAAFPRWRSCLVSTVYCERLPPDVTTPPTSAPTFLHVADAVVYLNALPRDEVVAWAHQLDRAMLVKVLQSAELRRSVPLLRAIVQDGAADVLEGMDDDRLADRLARLPEADRDAALRLLQPATRASVQQLMDYPEDSAGRIMTTRFVQVPQDWSAGQALAYLRQPGHRHGTVYALYVADAEGRLRFVLSLRELVNADPEQPLAALWSGAAPITVHALADREDVTRLIRLYNFLALPVVDEAQRVIGIVTVDDVIDALMEEAQEDMNRFGGGEHMGAPYLETGFLAMVKKRGAWLALLFLGEMLTSSAMQHYELALEKAVVLAMFIPLIMSSGGNSGSQATSLLIRGLALGEVRLRDWWRVLGRELPTSLVLGAGLGAIGFARIVAWQHLGFYDYGEHYLLIAATIWASLVGIVCFGSSIGSMLPFVLQRLGLDPASASAPLVATLVDVLGLVIYFSVAAAVLGGALL